MYLTSNHENIAERVTKLVETCVNSILLSERVNNFLATLSSEDKLSISKPSTTTDELPKSENKA